MDTRQLRNVKRIGTGFAAGLMVLSLGLMVRGAMVPTKAAFDAGVFGFQLFPIAVSAILIRISLPLILNTLPGRALIGLVSPVIASVGAAAVWLWNRSVSPANVATGAKVRTHEQSDTRDNPVLEHLLYYEDPEVGINPMEFIPEDPILRPNEYRPNFSDMFGDDRVDV